MVPKNNIINWGQLQDRHLMGLTPLGKVFIRLNRENKVNGMYTMFGDVEKFVPIDETQENLESAKKILSNIVKNKIEQDILLKKDLKL